MFSPRNEVPVGTSVGTSEALLATRGPSGPQAADWAHPPDPRVLTSVSTHLDFQCWGDTPVVNSAERGPPSPKGARRSRSPSPDLLFGSQGLAGQPLPAPGRFLVKRRGRRHSVTRPKTPPDAPPRSPAFPPALGAQRGARSAMSRPRSDSCCHDLQQIRELTPVDGDVRYWATCFIDPRCSSGQGLR